MNYCDGKCKVKSFTSFQFLPPTYTSCSCVDHYLWVCSGCLKPSYPIYENLLRRCEDCFTLCALPWETFCSKCFYRNEKEGARYSGLSAARAIGLGLRGPPSRAWILGEVVAFCDLSSYPTWTYLLALETEESDKDPKNLLTA